MNHQPSFRTLCYTLLWPLWARNKLLYSLTGLGLLITGIAIHQPALSLFRLSLVMLYTFASGALLLTVAGFNVYGISSRRHQPPKTQLIQRESSRCR